MGLHIGQECRIIGGRQIPQPHFAQDVAADQGTAVWADIQKFHRPIVPHQPAQRPGGISSGQIPQQNQVISASRSQNAAVIRKINVAHPAAMPIQHNG